LIECRLYLWEQERMDLAGKFADIGKVIQRVFSNHGFQKTKLVLKRRGEHIYLHFFKYSPDKEFFLLVESQCSFWDKGMRQEETEKIQIVLTQAVEFTEFAFSNIKPFTAPGIEKRSVSECTFHDPLDFDPMTPSEMWPSIFLDLNETVEEGHVETALQKLDRRFFDQFVYPYPFNLIEYEHLIGWKTAPRPEFLKMFKSDQSSLAYCMSLYCKRIGEMEKAQRFLKLAELRNMTYD